MTKQPHQTLPDPAEARSALQLREERPVGPRVRQNIVPLRFRPGVLNRGAKDASLGELQRLVQFFAPGDELAMARVRAILLLACGKNSAAVHGEVGFSERQVFRWLAWWREGGLRGLLRGKIQDYRQCSRCHTLGLVSEHFSPTMWICRPCNAERVAKWRQTPSGKATATAYERSEARCASVYRYRKTKRGKATRRFEYLRRTLRGLQSEEN